MISLPKPLLVLLPLLGSHANVQAGFDEIVDTGREVVITMPAVDLPAMADADHHGHSGIFPPILEIALPMHGYLRGFDYAVLDEQGNELPTEILHHFNVIDPDHRELFLPISQRILAAGNETGAQSMPRLLFGVPVYAGQRLVINAMLHNPTGVEHQNVSLQIRLKYVKVGRPWPLFEVFPFQIDVAFPAGDKSVDLPPGHSAFSWEGSPHQAGRVVVVGSHMHQHATDIQWLDVTAGDTLWTGLPVYDDGALEGVTIGKLYRTLGVKIYPDHVYRVTVSYHNPTQDTIPGGGMGVIGGVFVPAVPGAWPRADVSHPLYALDRQHYLQQVRGRYEVIATGAGVVGTPSATDSATAGHAH